MRHRVTILATLALLLIPLVGCPSFGAENSVQAKMSEMMDRLTPIVVKATEQLSTSNIAAAGGVHAISPGYKGKVKGIFGTTFEGEFDIELKNVAGMLTWSAAGQGEKDKPVVVPLSQPTAPTDPLANIKATIELIREVRALDAKPPRAEPKPKPATTPVPDPAPTEEPESEPAATQPA